MKILKKWIVHRANKEDLTPPFLSDSTNKPSETYDLFDKQETVSSDIDGSITIDEIIAIADASVRLRNVLSNEDFPIKMCQPPFESPCLK